MAILNLCLSHECSLISPVFSDIFLPISLMVSLVVEPNTPDVSIATGSNLYFRTKSGYFDLLAFSALVAAWPASSAEKLTTLSPNVLTQVASQHNAFPWLKGK